MQNKELEYMNTVNWTQFIIEFREEQNEFIKTLSNYYPTLSKTEFKLCCLIRSGFTTNEIAKLTNRTVRSVESVKYRLRKKLPITTHEDLSVFLMRI